MRLFWIAFALLTPTIAKAQAPDTSTKAQLNQAIKLVLASYNNATAYSGTIVTRLSKGKEYTTTTLHVNVRNDVKKGYISSAIIEETLDIATKKLTLKSANRTIDDGTSMIQIYQDRHEYAAIPREPSRISDLVSGPLHDCMKMDITFDAKPRKLDGRDYYEIVGTGVKGKVDILIDQETIRVRLIHMEIPEGSLTRVAEVTITDQLFGKDVLVSNFDATPPKGFAKVALREDPYPWD